MENSNEESSIFEEANQAIQKIKEATKNLEEIQKSCPHKEYSLRNLGPEEGKFFSLRRVCKDCSKDLGYATQSEIDSWAKS